MREEENGRRRCRVAIGGLLVAWLAVLFSAVAAGAVIGDIGRLSQAPLAYLDPADADRPLLSPAEQARLNGEFDLLYFAPWHRTEPHHSPELASWGFRKYAVAPGYGKDGRPHPPGWIRKLADNARPEDFAKRVYPAITVNPTDFRHLPTRDIHLATPKGSSADHPFDNLQVSTAPPGVPVLVLQVSRDRRWCLVETNHLLGWVPADDVAAVDREFVGRWQNGRYAVVVRDKTPVLDGGRVLFRAPLGAIFPRAGDDRGPQRILTAARDSRGNAVAGEAAIAREATADWPLPFTPREVARLAAELAEEPYGWGGLYGRRDCSALVRDIATPFGVWLPRNSGDQAVAWRFVSLRELPPAEKEALIVRQGVPWRTLLWVPGHVMLYIGHRDGKPLVFHNLWSVRSNGADGRPERRVVGRAAVTTLNPGGLPDAAGAGEGYLASLEAMTFLGEPLPGGQPQSEAVR